MSTRRRLISSTARSVRYLAISKDGGKWVDTGVEGAGYHIFAHEATEGAASANAYVMAQAANTGNVHLNQDAP